MRDSLLRFLLRPLQVGLLFLLTPLAGNATEPFAGLRDRWRHYESPHFELYSQQDDEASRDLLYRLELLHHVFLNANNLGERDPVPVTVYLFGRKKDFDAYKPEAMAKAAVAGLYLNRPDRATIMVAPGGQPAETRRVIFHEYIHHLLRITAATPPPWLNEGMAEIFSTIEVKGGKLIFGSPIPGHVYQLQSSRLIPLPSLFMASRAGIYGAGDNHAGLFYAQSWAVLHYWYFGRTKIDKDRIDRFINLCMSQGQRLEAQQIEAYFREATGGDYMQMEEELENYVRSGRYHARSLPLPTNVPARNSFSVRPVPADELRERLAELALRVRGDPHARLVLLEAIGGKRGSRALEALGAQALVDNNDNLALQRWREAVAAGSRNPAVYHQIGIRESLRWFRQFDYYFRLPAERAEELRELLRRSIEYAPRQVAAYELLAWVEAAAPRPDPAAINLVQRKFDGLQDKANTLLALALARVRLGDRTGGLALLDQAELLDPSESTRYAIAISRQVLEGKR